MTREEQIRTEARKEKTTFAENGFVRGAEWADNNPNWISVEDRLPEEKDRGESDVVLVTDGEQIWHGYYWFYFSDGRPCNDWFSQVKMPTHWMPMPKMPKKNEN